MGFFSDVKSDLSATPGAEGQGAPESLDLDSMLDKLDSSVPMEPAEPEEMVVTETFFGADDEVQPVADAAEAVSTDAGDEEFLSKLSEALGTPEDATPEPADMPLFEEAVAEPAPEQPVSAFESAPVPEPFTMPEAAPEAGFVPPVENTYAQEGGFTMDMDLTSTAPATDENAVITGGMTVNGDVSTSGNLELMGKVTGNVRANGKLTISGEVNGDSVAAEIYAENARVNGEVKSQGSVKVGQSTVIIGNIYANGAVIAGAVKGDIDVHGPVILDTTAIVMGNIKSQSVQINNGAVIEGMCSQVYAEVNPSAFFENLKG